MTPRPPSGELAAAGSGGIAVVSVIALAARYGVTLDPEVAGYIVIAAGWVGARVRRYLNPGRHATACDCTDADRLRQ